MITFNSLQRALSTLLYLPWPLPLCGPTQEPSRQFELNLCCTLLSPQAVCPVAHLPNFSNECLVPAAFIPLLLAPLFHLLHTYFLPMLVCRISWRRAANSLPNPLHCLPFSPPFSTAVDTAIMSLFKLSSLGFYDSPQSSFFPSWQDGVFLFHPWFSPWLSGFSGAMSSICFSLKSYLWISTSFSMTPTDLSFLLSHIFLAAC